MKKQLEVARIFKKQIDLDYTEQELSTVTLTFAIIGDDLDAAQGELVELIQNAIAQHCSLPEANFEYYHKMMEGLKAFDWSKAHVSYEKVETE